jgi:vacuolar protein sorting-associated protein 26
MDYIKSFYTIPPSIQIILEPSKHKNTKYHNKHNKHIELPTYSINDIIKGKIIIHLNKNKNLEHQGIKIHIIGIIENTKDNLTSSKFYDECITLSSPSTINNELTQIDFTFQTNNTPSKQYETYYGSAVNVRYFIYSYIITNPKQIYNQSEIVIINPYSKELFIQEDNPPIKIEIGIEKLIHVVFELEKTNFYLKDVLIGKVTFVELNVPLHQMEIQIIRKENLNFNNILSSESTMMGRFVLIDGTPKKGMSVPFRYYLNGIKNLSPSVLNVDNKFSVQYYLHIEFLDYDERKFFKRVEIKMMRLNNMKREGLLLFKCNN